MIVDGKLGFHPRENFTGLFGGRMIAGDSFELLGAFGGVLGCCRHFMDD
jgi:hypothetical protein